MTSISKEYILGISKKIFIEKGVASINMRAIAKECDIALGSIYNYFPSKAYLLAEIVASIWSEIFSINNEYKETNSFLDKLEWVFENVVKNSDKYPNFFKSHRSFFKEEEKEIGRDKMEIYFNNIKKELLDILKNDIDVRQEFFTDEITPNLYIDYVFVLFFDILEKGDNNFKPLLAFIRRSIYRG